MREQRQEYRVYTWLSTNSSFSLFCHRVFLGELGWSRTCSSLAVLGLHVCATMPSHTPIFSPSIFNPQMWSLVMPRAGCTTILSVQRKEASTIKSEACQSIWKGSPLRLTQKPCPGQPFRNVSSLVQRHPCMTLLPKSYIQKLLGFS